MAVNQALRKVIFERSSDYVVLLNNDVVVTPGWLETMQSALVTNKFDALGPLTSENNPHSLDALRGVVPTLPKFTTESPDERAQVLRKQYGNESFAAQNMLSFFCCLMKRDLIDSIGLLDENIFAYGEDNDYFERMKRMGKRFGIVLGAYVHHDHGATSSTMGANWAEEQKKKAIDYLKEKYSSAPALAE